MPVPKYKRKSHPWIRETDFSSIPESIDENMISVRIPKKEAVMFGHKFVSIHVGEEESKKAFTVHETLICAHSKFFKKAMDGTWREAEDKIINLPDDDPIVFDLYVQLLYTGRLPCKSESETLADSEQEYVVLSKLYVLAEKIQDIDAKRAAMDALLSLSRDTREAKGEYMVPSLEAVSTIYSGTLEPCAARRLFVDLYTCKPGGDWFDKTQPYPTEFLAELVVALLENRCLHEIWSLEVTPSMYHDKDDI